MRWRVTWSESQPIRSRSAVTCPCRLLSSSMSAITRCAGCLGELIGTRCQTYRLRRSCKTFHTATIRLNSSSDSNASRVRGVISRNSGWAGPGWCLIRFPESSHFLHRVHERVRRLRFDCVLKSKGSAILCRHSGNYLGCSPLQNTKTVRL